MTKGTSAKFNLIAFVALTSLCSFSQEVLNKFPKKITTAGYAVDHTAGMSRSNVMINGKLLLSIFWMQRWTNAKANNVKSKTTVSKDKTQISVHSTYNWAGGVVEETRVYTNDSIKLDYTYIPQEKERVKTNKINLFLKFYSVTKDYFSFTKFGKSGGQGYFKDMPKGKYALCSSISMKAFEGKELDIATDNKCRMILEQQTSSMTILVTTVDAWSKPFTVKGQKYHQSLIIEFIPAKGQKDIPFIPVKISF
jgi:hypothetical protein